MASSSSDFRDWEHLLTEILTSIAKRFTATDYLNFAGVCSSWAWVASPANGMPLPLSLGKIPYLLLSGDKGEQSESCHLLNVFDNSLQVIDPLPEIRGKWWVGSQFGWITLSDEFSNPSLFNPLTRSHIILPPITTLPDVKPVYNPDGGSVREYLYRQATYPKDTDEFCSWSLKDFRHNGIYKLVLSASPAAGDGRGSFAAMGLMSVFRKVMYVRPGEESWSFLDLREWPGEVVGKGQDMLFRDGKFLVLAHSGKVKEVDLGGGGTEEVKVRPIANSIRGYYDNMYLVDSGGDLLLICRDMGRIKIQERRRPKHMLNTSKFYVWRLNDETASWDPVTSLGADRSIFIGVSYSVALTSQEIPGLKGNCIYYTDDRWDIIPCHRKMVRDLGVYSLGDGSFEIIFPPDPRMTWPPPIWFTPSLL